MRFALSIAICLGLIVSGAPPSSGSVQTSSTAVQSTTSANASRQPLLEDGTPVKLRIAQTVSSADAHVNDRVEFEVLEEVRVSDVLIIPKGGLAWGTVTEAEPKRRMARGGKLEIVMDSVRLADGEKAALRATKGAKGGGHTGAMTAGIVATGLIFWPAAPFFLFMHGKDITIPKGTEVPTFVDGNLPLEFSKFQPNIPSSPVASSSSPSSVTSASVVVTSTPTGAEITIDESFVGNAPSTITLTPGKHRVSVRKQGFDIWEREINVSGGAINIAAELKASPVATGTSASPKKPEPAPNPPPTEVKSQLHIESAPPTETAEKTGWIGVSVKDDAGKIIITAVEHRGPGDRAELQIGDSIQQLNGEPVKTAQEFELAISHATPGSQLRIGYIRTFWMYTATVSVEAQVPHD